MQHAASKRVTVPRAGHDTGDALVEELQSLFERVHAVTRAVTTAIALEQATSGTAVEADIVVLDDVTPRYLRANSALAACNLHLGDALHFLKDGQR
jgi:hypothetical protein